MLCGFLCGVCLCLLSVDNWFDVACRVRGLFVCVFGVC